MKSYKCNNEDNSLSKNNNREDTFLKICINYFSDNLSNIIKFLLFIGIYFSVDFLYDTSRESTRYASILVCTLYIVFLIYDFRKYYNKHIMLKNVKCNLENGVEDIGKVCNLIEQDYKEIINVLYESKSNLLSKNNDDKNKMIDYYTMWAHQIKVPVSALSMIIQSMENSSEKTLMKEQLFRTEQYIEMVLQYIRLENFSSDLKIRKCSLKNIINSCVKKYSVQFIHKKISLNISNIESVILTDEKWISFVIEQILSNSLKYTKKGTISIYMDYKLTNVLIIEDTGIGISPEDIPRVFDNGFTGYNGRINKKSSGIGLYLCKQIIDKLNHTISIKSEIGKGTKVMIDFSVQNIEI